MKIHNFLSNCVILLILFSFSNNLSDQSNSPKSKGTESNKPFFQGYFYLQTLYPGLDAIQNINLSSTKSKLKYFTLNNNLLYYSDSLEDASKIRGI